MNQLSRRLKSPLREFAELSRVLETKATAKKVHRLRILTRRLRAALWISERIPLKKSLKGLKKDLRHLGRRLGECRELDVLSKDIELYGLEMTSIEKKQDRAYEKLQKILSKPKFRMDMKYHLKEFARSLRQVPSLPTKDLINATFSEKDTWPSVFPKDKTEIHTIRIRIKKMLYRLELLGRPSPQLKSLQKSLGRAHDLEILEKACGKNRKISGEQHRLLLKSKATYKKILLSRYTK